MSAPRVLVVDDSGADQFIARHFPGQAAPDVQITTAYDGQQALEILDTEGATAFDYILLDINMPRMDGHQFLAEYATRRSTKPPVVIMLTSSDQVEDRERCSAYPFVEDYRVKPLDEDWVNRLLSPT